MGRNTKIEWTDNGASWNPWHGCIKISAGCKNCYMYTEKKAYGQEPDLVVRSKTKFNDPLKWVKRGDPPKYCFTCSWSDFFIQQADEWRTEAWQVIRWTPQIIYQILTKRAERLDACLPSDWNDGYPNVWLGVSVESPKYKDRIDILRETPAAVRMLSLEPLLEDLGQLDLRGIGWAIVGGESGPGARPMHPDWARSIRDQCQAAGVPFFFKQWGEWVEAREGARWFTVVHLDGREGAGLEGAKTPSEEPKSAAFMEKVGKKAAGRLLDGKEWNQYPGQSMEHSG